MAFIQHTERFSPLAGIFAFIAKPVESLSDRYKSWQEQNRVRSELLAYSDRELADMGLSRWQVQHMDLS